MCYPNVQFHHAGGLGAFGYAPQSYFNIAYSHMTVPLEYTFGGDYTNLTGWFHIFVQNAGNCITDGNDVIDLIIDVLAGSSY